MTLKRSTPPRYMALVNVGNAVHPHSVHITSDLRHSEGECEELFELVDAIALQLRVDFATVDLARSGQDPQTRMVSGGTTVHLGAYLDGGPEAIWVRTYFGPRLVELAGGPARWPGVGGSWRELANGTLVLDVIREPLLRLPEELKAAQMALLPGLRHATGIFRVDDEPTSRPTRGPRWQPPPSARWPG